MTVTVTILGVPDLRLVTVFQNFSQHSPIEGTAEEACVGEVSFYNPGFPARKVFSALKKLKNTAELTQQETGN